MTEVPQAEEAELSFLNMEKENLLEKKRAEVTALFPSLGGDHHIVMGTEMDAEMILSRGGTGILCYADARDGDIEDALVILEEENQDGSAVLYIREVTADLSAYAKESVALPAALMVKDGNVVQAVSLACGTEEKKATLRTALHEAMEQLRK